MSDSTLDHVKDSVGGQSSDPYLSTLTEPWSKVNNLLLFIRDRIHCLQAKFL